MKTKGQKGFAIFNIIVGVILVMASFAMFGDPSVGPGGILSLAIGGAFWGVGAWALSILNDPMAQFNTVAEQVTSPPRC